jgi:hypothetical protein
MEFIGALLLFIYAVIAAVIAAIVGVLVCFGQVIGECVIAVVHVFYTHPSELPERANVFTVPPEGERAKPNFFYGPARSDARYVWQVTWDRWQQAAARWQSRIGRMFDPGNSVLAFSAPIAGGLTAGLAVMLPIMAVVMGLTWLANEILLNLCTAGVRCAARFLRIIDSGLLFVRHIRVRCIACFEAIPYPAYLCPVCKTPHWDIRPGKYGVFHRTCECGNRMPTTLLRGTAQLEAICPHRGCRQPLEYRPGEVQEVILPLFGPKAAGKTLLLCGIVRTLQKSVRPGIRVDYGNADTAARLAELGAAIEARSPVPATPAVPLKTYVLRLQIGRYRRILQLPDPAGELFYDSRRSADLLFLGAASTFILVIDPLSIEDCWQSLSTARQRQLTDYRSAAPRPQEVYQQTAERIAQMGKRNARRRLAVVFSRADLLEPEHGLAAGDGEGIQKWAEDSLGLSALLRDARSDFQEVAVFHTAPFTSRENGLNALVHWIMRAEGSPPVNPEPDSPTAP